MASPEPRPPSPLVATCVEDAPVEDTPPPEAPPLTVSPETVVQEVQVPPGPTEPGPEVVASSTGGPEAPPPGGGAPGPEKLEAEPASGPNSLAVSVGSESPASDLESTELNAPQEIPAAWDHLEDEAEASRASEPAGGVHETSPAPRPPDCVKEIRDLVVEVIEVEMVHKEE